MTHDDATLLRRFAVEGSESAFSELVARYLDLVYSAALRQVNGDSGLAADICQSVFIDLARKARSIRPEAALAAWLHRATRLAALAALRSEGRRAAREQEVALMHEQNEPAVDWNAFRPAIDAALDDLNDQDREAVLLRYFQQQPLREVAAALGLSENAARMRVDRALDKLRGVLAKRGVTSTTSALSVALTAQALTPAPAGLAATLSTSAVSAAAVSTTSTLLPLMASIKLKLGVAAVVAAAVGTPLVLQHNANARLRDENLNLQMQTTELERLRRENAELAASRVDVSELARLRAQQSELMRLRAEVGALREQARKLNAATAARTASSPATAKSSPEPEGKEFIPTEKWTEVGADTPERAFQSFLAVLKAGDPARIASAVHWDVQWKDEITEDDKKLIEKSMQDYLDMLKRAPNKLAAFRLGSIADAGEERKRVYFSTRTTDGTQIDSNFEMAYADGAWQPVLSMRWLDRKNSSSFATSPVFGPEIDLEP